MTKELKVNIEPSDDGEGIKVTIEGEGFALGSAIAGSKLGQVVLAALEEADLGDLN